MNLFHHPDTSFKKLVGMYQSVLVTNEVEAFAWILRIMIVHEVFKPFIILQIDWIPLFGAPMMQVIDRVEIHVFFVPAEHSFPWADV